MPSCRLSALLTALATWGCATAPPSPPPPARPPPAPLVLQPPSPPPPPEPSPRDALDWATYFVPPELHAPLGLTAEALAARPPAPRDDGERARAEAAKRAVTAEACLPIFTSRGSDGELRRTPAEAWAALTLGADGQPRDVVVRIDEARHLPEAERCAAEAIGRWTLGAPRLGGRVWLALRGQGAEVALTPVEGPDLEGASPARPKERDCVAGSIRLPRALQGIAMTTVVKFAIGRDGLPRRFRVLSPANLPVGAAVAIFEGIRQCDWIPGATKGGEPIPFWVLLPVRFTAR